MKFISSTGGAENFFAKVYQIPCHDCDFSYIGETKRSFSIRKKEHLADIRF